MGVDYQAEEECGSSYRQGVVGLPPGEGVQDAEDEEAGLPLPVARGCRQQQHAGPREGVGGAEEAWQHEERVELADHNEEEAVEEEHGTGEHGLVEGVEQ